jgi:hypothetical protein
MQSKMLLGVLSALFTMALLFTLAVPRQRGQGAAEADQATAPAVSGRAAALAVEPEPVPELVDGVWQPSGYALRMPAPEGWVASRRRSRAYLHRDPSRPLQGNFSLIRLPNLYGKTLEGLLEENREELEGNDQFELHDIALVELADVRRIRVDYTGTPRGGEPVRFAGLIWLQGREQVVLTFTIEAGLWKARAPEAERCLSGLAAVPAPVASADEPADAGAAR